MISQAALTKYHPLAPRYHESGWLEHMAVLCWISNDIMVKQSSSGVHRFVYGELNRQPGEQARQILDFLNWQIGEQTMQHIQKTAGLSKSNAGN